VLARFLKQDRRSHPSNGFYKEIVDLVQFQNEIGDVKVYKNLTITGLIQYLKQ